MDTLQPTEEERTKLGALYEALTAAGAAPLTQADTDDGGIASRDGGAAAAPPLLDVVTFPATGRGVRVTRTVKAREVLARVPLALAWTARAARAHPTLSRAFAKCQCDPPLADDDVLAIHLMWARANRDACTPLQRAHLAFLPMVGKGPSALDLTVFWTERELASLAGSRARDVARALKAQPVAVSRNT